MFTSIVDDVLRQCRAQSADVHQQVLAGGIEIDAYRVDAALHRLVETVLEFRLVYIVLILPHSDALRVNLDKFGQRIHQSTADAYSATHRDILIRKLLAGCLRCRIDRRAILADDEDREPCPYLLDKLLRLAAGRSIANGDSLYLIVVDHLLQVHLRLHPVVHGRMGEDGFVVEQIALRIQTYHLAARTETRVDAHHALLSQWGREQQLTHVAHKHIDGFLVGLLLAQRGKLRLYRGFQESLVAIFYRFGHQLLAFALSTNIAALQPVDAVLVVGRDAYAQDALLFAASHGQQPMARTTAQGLGELEVVAILGCFVGVALGFDHCRRDDGLASERLPDPVAALLLFAHRLSDDILRPFQGRCGIDHIALHETGCRLHRFLFTLEQQ